MPKIKCLLVDDHILFRQGIRRLLESESDVEVVGESANAADAVLKAGELQPNVILMDIGMSGLSAFEAARQIHKEWPAMKLVFLSMYDDEEYLIQGLEAGAAGYVLKDAAASQLVTAVREAYKGGRYMSPRMLNRLVEEFRIRVPGHNVQLGGSALTPREREILKLLAEGETVREISVLLAVKAKTVETHKNNLMRKLDIHNKAQLVAYAFRHKIVRLLPDQSADPARLEQA